MNLNNTVGEKKIKFNKIIISTLVLVVVLLLGWFAFGSLNKFEGQGSYVSGESVVPADGVYKELKKGSVCPDSDIVEATTSNNESESEICSGGDNYVEIEETTLCSSSGGTTGNGVKCNKKPAKCDVGSAVVVPGKSYSYIDTVENKKTWRNFYLVWHCVSQDYLKNGPRGKSGEILVSDTTIDKNQTSCIAPVKLNVMSVLAYSKTEIEITAKDLFKPIVEAFQWPQYAYRVCISDNCFSALRLIKGCAQTGACVASSKQREIVDRAIGKINYLMPVNLPYTGEIFNSITDLIDPVTWKPKDVVDGSLIYFNR